MATCDLCNGPAGVESVCYKCDQFRTAVSKGLRPADAALMVSQAFGASKESATAGWVQQVMSDTTDWVLCNACARRVAQCGAIGSATHPFHDFLFHSGRDKDAQAIAAAFAADALLGDESYYGTCTLALGYVPDLAGIQRLAAKTSLLKRLFSKPAPPEPAFPVAKSFERGAHFVRGEVRMLSPSLVSLIAGLRPSQISAVAKTWTAEWPSQGLIEDRWDEAHLVEVLRKISNIAKKAETEHRQMFWCIGRGRAMEQT